jgi:triphosphoribosyl-dephospho-CoA synthase
LQFVAPSIARGLANGWSMSASIIHTHVKMMAEFPDNLIARKCGREVAERSAIMARTVLDSGEPGGDDYHRALCDLDFWLRSDGHRRNPGTTADLIAAGIFVGLLDETIPAALPLEKRT